MDENTKRIYDAARLTHCGMGTDIVCHSVCHDYACQFNTHGKQMEEVEYGQQHQQAGGQAHQGVGAKSGRSAVEAAFETDDATRRQGSQQGR